jgi:hypothetical protein
LTYTGSLQQQEFEDKEFPIRPGEWRSLLGAARRAVAMAGFLVEKF